VTLFSIGFFYLGVEYWFSDRVRTAVDESVVVAGAYYDEHKQAIRGDILAMAAISIPCRSYQGIPGRGQRAGAGAQPVGRMVFDGHGTILARTGFTFALGLDQPPPSAIERRAGVMATSR